MQHLSQIRDLDSQLIRAQERINKLESVKRTLENRKEAESAEVSTQLQKLQMVKIYVYIFLSYFYCQF